MHKLIILFGVSGSGKSTIGKKLSKDLKFKFIEGDDFHSINNINKMKRRLALNDNDREEWLQALNNKLKDQSINTVLACSALKEKYRKKLIRGLDINIFWFCFKNSPAFVLPCPIFSPSYEYQAPAFSTILCSAPISNNTPALLMPLP